MKILLFLYIIPAVLVLVQGFLIESASKRKLPFNLMEYTLAIIIPVWNWYMAYQLFSVVQQMKISIRPTMDFGFYHSFQIFPSVAYIMGSDPGILILFPFYGSLTITPKGSSEE